MRFQSEELECSTNAQVYLQVHQKARQTSKDPELHGLIPPSLKARHQQTPRVAEAKNAAFTICRWSAPSLIMEPRKSNRAFIHGGSLKMLRSRKVVLSVCSNQNEKSRRT
jgi:hypothetical protein